MQKVKWSREEKKKKLIPSFRDIGIILRGYKRFIILILALAVSLTTWWYIQKEQAWVFSETEYEGLINLDKSELDRVIENQFGRLMNKIRTHELENRIRGQFVEISEIRAEKMFPDRVKFTIVEKIPIALYININGYYLIDINGEVIQAYNSETPYSFSRQDY
jgi:cell division septal protein FtsQ